MVKITIEEQEYPQTLKNILNPPLQLYAIGNLELLTKKGIAIIGSRKCSEDGKYQAKKFAYELAKQGLVIISGLAKGIDAEAHRGALEAKGNTIAVLGNGLNHIFPIDNAELYDEIIKNEGLIISEYSPEIKPASKQFLERNRIVSGISIGVLVIEASKISGTSVTARLAVSQGKKVFALPHEIENIHGKGTNQLIRKGATLVTSTKEIIDEFNFLNYKETVDFIKEEDKLKQNEIKIIDSKQNEIYKLLKEGVKSINEIIIQSKQTIQEVNKNIFLLEIQGYIKKVAGGYTCIETKREGR